MKGGGGGGRGQIDPPPPKKKKLPSNSPAISGLSPFSVGLYIYPKVSDNKGIASLLCRRCCVGLLIFLSEA